MKNLVFILCILLSQALKAFEPYCAYVSVKEGIAIRKKPSLSLDAKDSLVFGDKVYVYEEAGEEETVHNGETIRAKWVKVVVVGLFMEKNDDNPEGLPLPENKAGYILDIYLSEAMEEIPPASLYNYHRVVVNNYFPELLFKSDLDISYGENTSNYYLVKESTNDCYPYYNKNLSSVQISGRLVNDKSIEALPSDTRLDTLRAYLNLELVDIEQYRDKIITNKFAIDTSQKPLNKPDATHKTSFYLPLDNGDSLFMERVLHDWSDIFYIGKIDYLNKYILYDNFYKKHFLADRRNGIWQGFTGGTPFVSPSGKFIVDVNLQNFIGKQGTFVTISAIDDSLKLTHTISVDFKSWEPLDIKFFLPFWVSDTELILKVFPIDNSEISLYGSVYRVNGRFNTDEINDEYHNFQYIKLKVLNW